MTLMLVVVASVSSIVRMVAGMCIYVVFGCVVVCECVVTIDVVRVVLLLMLMLVVLLCTLMLFGCVGIGCVGVDNDTCVWTYL